MKQPKLKSQFLHELFPTASEKTARRWLGYEIEHNPELKQQLYSIGYTPHCKLLSVKMQQLIIDALCK